MKLEKRACRGMVPFSRGRVLCNYNLCWDPVILYFTHEDLCFLCFLRQEEMATTQFIFSRTYFIPETICNLLFTRCLWKDVESGNLSLVFSYFQKWFCKKKSVCFYMYCVTLVFGLISRFINYLILIQVYTLLLLPMPCPPPLMLQYS